MTRRGRLLFGVGVLALVSWRVAVVRAEGTHSSELTPLVRQLTPSLDSFPPGLTNPGSVSLVYVYSTGCPYCRMDHSWVREVGRGVAAGKARFIAMHVGGEAGSLSYWGADSASAPDTLVSVSQEAATGMKIRGVPVLMVVRGDTIVAAWQGKLRWSTNGLAQAINCRLGAIEGCLFSGMIDFWSGLGGRMRALQDLGTPTSGL